MSATESRSSFGLVPIGALVLALAAASVHLYLFFIEGFLGSGTMLPIYQLLFVGNFLAYTTLAILLNLPIPSLARFRPIVRVLLIAIATASIISYFYVGVIDTTGNVTKVIEVLLIGVMTVDAAVSDPGDGSSGR